MANKRLEDIEHHLVGKWMYIEEGKYKGHVCRQISGTNQAIVMKILKQYKNGRSLLEVTDVIPIQIDTLN